MRVRAITSLLAGAGLAGAASAQFITTPGVSATFSMGWIEDPAFAHNDNGVLEPGEHALILTTFSFSNQYQYVDFAPAVGAFTRGIAAGGGLGYINITSGSPDPSGLYNHGLTTPPSTSIGPNANNSGTIGYGVRGGWRGAGDISNGNPVTNGFVNLQPNQFFGNNGITLSTTNPITNFDRLGWAPASYSARTVSFSFSPAAGAGLDALALYLDLDGETDGTQAGYQPGNTDCAAYLPLSSINFGSVDIPIAPVPAGFAVLGMAGLIAGRRRGRAPWEGSP